MKKAFILKCLIFSVFIFASCKEQKNVVINYNLPTPIITDVLSKSIYATIENDLEQIGTITEIYYRNEYTQKDNITSMERTYVSDASKGYLKKSHPAELAFRTPKLILTAQDNKLINMEGYENFDSLVVAKISIPDRWKKQISRLTRPIDLERIEKRRWELTHLLKGETPTNTNITSLLKAKKLLPNLSNASIDSVVTKGVKKMNGKECFTYIVYLKEKEPFPYFIWEQHIASVESGKPFKSYSPTEAKYENRYEIAISPKNGILCHEREYKFGTHGMQNKETKDSVTFKSQITHEREYKEVSE